MEVCGCLSAFTEAWIYLICSKAQSTKWELPPTGHTLIFNTSFSLFISKSCRSLSFPWADPNCHKRDPLQSQSHFECFHSAEMNKQENHTADFSFTLLTLITIITAQYYLGQRSRKWQPTPVFLPGKSHGQNRLAGYWPWGHRESEASENSTLHISRKIRVDTNRSFDSKMSMRNSRWISWPLYLHKFE